MDEVPVTKLRDDPTQIVIVSKGRAGRVETLGQLPSDRVVLVVPSFEKEKYAEAHPGIAIAATPAHVRGIVATRQWVISKYSSVFMVDDDVYAVVRMYEGDSKRQRVNDPELVYELVQSAACMARRMGAYLYGFSTYRAPVNYVSQQPFKLNGYLNASFCGFVEGHGLEYNLDMPEAEDHWISLYCQFKHRYLLIDQRYSFFTRDNFKGTGGIASDRTLEGMRESTMILKKFFGDAVHVKRPTTSKGKVNEGERTIVIPY